MRPLYRAGQRNTSTVRSQPVKRYDSLKIRGNRNSFREAVDSGKKLVELFFGDVSKDFDTVEPGCFFPRYWCRYIIYSYSLAAQAGFHSDVVKCLPFATGDSGSNLCHII